MFECDQDEDMADNIGCRISEETKSEEFAWVYFFTTGQKHSIYPDIDAAVVREKLDSGLGDKLFDEYRAEENDYGGSLFDEKRKYLVIVLGALMMRVGAKIREADIQHLRELVPDIPCREKWIYPLMDNGFRGPGKRQFLVALDHYQAGTPRCFSNKASCFRCGKMDTELPEETPLLRCGACEAHVWFCDEVRLDGCGCKWHLANNFVVQECQRWYWQHHNKVCGPRQREKGNV